MKTEWRELLVSEFADIVGGTTPSTSDPLNYGGEIPWITPKDLSDQVGRYVARGERNLTLRGVEAAGLKILPRGTVLLSTRAPIGYVAIAENPVTTNQGFRNLVVKPGFEPEFIYYLLRHDTDRLRAFASGTTFGELSGSTLKGIRYRIPPQNEQRAIAAILGSLDDKNELNHRMNRTLEDIARAIFQSWFVAFEPVRAKAEGRWKRFANLPGMPAGMWELWPSGFEDLDVGEVPMGWRAGTLADLADLNPESWGRNSAPAEIDYVDLGNTKWGRIESTTHYPWADAPSRAQRIVRSGDTIVGTVRPGNGSYAFVLQDGLTASTGFAVLRPKLPQTREFVYLAATASDNVEWLAHLADGAAYPAIRPETVSSTPVTLPDGSIHARFSQIVQPLFRQIAVNDLEVRSLAALRDALLPKLLSGEFRVPADGSTRGATT